jgi:hypothetical protein
MSRSQMSDHPDANSLPASMTYRTRLFVLFAAEVPKAVLLRRGPRRQQRLINWNLKNDTFVAGQWMKGDVRLWDLSPKGDKLLYWTAQYHFVRREKAAQDDTPSAFDSMANDRLDRKGRKRKIARYQRPLAIQDRGDARGRIGTAWTAVSRPPYFTALALWPASGAWLTGGGVFGSEHDIFIAESSIIPRAGAPVPAGLNIRSVFEMPYQSLERSAYEPSANESDKHIAIANALSASGAGQVDWIDVKSGPDMLFSTEGRLYRLKDWRWLNAGDYLSNAKLLADFRDMRFERMPPPDEAMQW